MYKPTLSSNLSTVLAGKEETTENGVHDFQDWNNPTYWQFIPSRYYELLIVLDKVVPLALKNRAKELSRLTESDKCWTDVGHLSFLDVGCGPGNILQLVNAYSLLRYSLSRNKQRRNMGFYLNGIEHDLRLAKIADASRLGCITHGDALEYKHYKQHDIIFYYRPIKDKELGEELDKKIYHAAKPGAIIIPNLPHWQEIGKHKGDKQLFINKDGRCFHPKIYDLSHTFQKAPLKD